MTQGNANGREGKHQGVRSSLRNTRMYDSEHVNFNHLAALSWLSFADGHAFTLSKVSVYWEASK